ncbi:MAG: tRNA guanosine(34) transglycosylase Tgt [Planctomycetota bacterium]
MTTFHYELLATDGRRRRGRVHTPHGTFETPCFAPVGTLATIKGLTTAAVRETGAELILSNAYHLHLRPGADYVARRGGLHQFMNWDGPILTDSGGYQIFSLAHRSRIDDDGVRFHSFIDGTEQFLSPERALEVQRDLGPDIAMVLDECPAGNASHELVRSAHERTLRWAERARDLHARWGGKSRGQAVFGIVQGGPDPELRQASADALVDMDFDGYAVGGLSVGETKAQMEVALNAAVDRLPEHKPRYLMGVGTPEDFVQAVDRGIDFFDCVTPTRHGRNHQAFTREGVLKLRNLKYAEDDRPLDENCTCHTCRTVSRAYLRHLAIARESLGGILLSLHNIHYFQDLMQEMRTDIEQKAAQQAG